MVVVLVVVVVVVDVFVVVAVVCCFSGHTTTALAVLKVVQLAVKLVVFPSKSKHCDFADEKIGETLIIDYGEEKQKYEMRYPFFVCSRMSTCRRACVQVRVA